MKIQSMVMTLISGMVQSMYFSNELFYGTWSGLGEEVAEMTKASFFK